MEVVDGDCFFPSSQRRVPLPTSPFPINGRYTEWPFGTARSTTFHPLPFFRGGTLDALPPFSFPVNGNGSRRKSCSELTED